MSVNRNVTVPDGPATRASSHGGFGGRSVSTGHGLHPAPSRPCSTAGGRTARGWRRSVGPVLDRRGPSILIGPARRAKPDRPAINGTYVRFLNSAGSAGISGYERVR